LKNQKGTAFFTSPAEFGRIFLGAQKRAQKNRAFRSKSSEAPMRFLWAFRYNPLRAPSGSAKSLRDFATSPLLGVVSRLRRGRSKAPALQSQMNT
jgi:hypothetical protein